MPNDEVENFLFGGGSRAAQFNNIGDQVTGTITHFEVAQQTDMETKEPLTWPDGRPRMQLIVDIQTELRDNDEDEGVRRIYAKGGNYEVAEGTGTSLRDAIADAVRKAGAKRFESGGMLTVGFTGYGKKTNRGFAAPKLYRARYEEPKQSVSADDIFGNDPGF